MMTREEAKKRGLALKKMIEEDERLEAEGHVFDYSFLDALPEVDDNETTTAIVFAKSPKKGKKEKK
jgi:hypothetical protein